MPIAALGSLIGSALTNVFNAGQNEEQRKWSEKMWNAQNEYNTPANQMKRLRSAGINPHFAIAGGQLGTGNASSQASMTSPTPYDFSPIGEGAARSVELYNQKRYQDAQIDLLNEQAQNQRTKNIYADWREYSEISERLANVDSKSEEAAFLRMRQKELSINIQTLSKENNVRIAKFESEKAMNDAHTKLLQAQEQQQNVLNKFAPEQQRIITDNLRKQGREIESAIRRNDRDSALKAAETALTQAQERGVKIDNYTKYEMSEYVIDEKFAQAEYERYKAGNEMKRYDEGELGYRLPAGGRKKDNPPSRRR